MIEPPQTLDRAGILTRIPHKGLSCLLDALHGWDTKTIVCEARSHLLATNPYRLVDRLPAVCAVEYASQAIALHSALKAERVSRSAAPAPSGYLASVRGLTLSVTALDGLAGSLFIAAEVLSAERDRMLYAFHIRHESTTIAEGRLSIALHTTKQ